ncbi:MAG: hypothetical protein EBR30_03340 [Cytophagia bacterium]|jgi:hypothetical protein|nr:hypothetical protein [Cytophagia bacterium]NBW34046.1 hypothetical protein [Cytophagia bacterium]
MPRGKSTKLKPFQKLLTVLASGKPVTIEEIDATLGKEIYMYRLSTYIWHIKTNANGVVKAIKDGRKVTAYQVINVKEMEDYLKRTGVTKSGFVPGQIEKKPSIAKLADLKAKPVKKAKTSVKKTKPVQPVEAVQPVAEEMTIVEVTETVTE